MECRKQAHVTDVCLLPFQRSQWVPTGHAVIDERVEQYYINGEDELNDTIGGHQIIGLKIGNPKRYLTAQLFELHQQLQRIVDDNMRVHLQVAEKYFDEAAVAALRWTTERKGSHDDIDQLLNGGHIERLNAHERAQLIPSVHCGDFEAFEWQKTQGNIMNFRIVIFDEPIEILPFLLAADSMSRLLFIRYEQKESQRSVISRAGEVIKYDDMRQALLFDLIHYGLQYQVSPLIIMRGDKRARITTYGEEIKIEGKPYLLQTPHIDLFAIRRPSNIDLTADTYQVYMDFYRRPFTLMLYQPALPLYYEVKMLEQWL